MGRKSSKKSNNSGDNDLSYHEPEIKITKADEKNFKMRSQNVHDPILSAVNEAQPYEEQANVHVRSSSLSTEGQKQLKDIFGQPIVQPDISNPTRARDERPLDTIRAFEYAITGDLTYKQQLETPQLGWKLRTNMPNFQSNPYGNSQYADTNENYNVTNTNNVISFGNDNPNTEQSVYVAPAPKVEEKKKKRGLFGRKKTPKVAAN
ncbi:hypothetical protein PACTADRAFT_43366 [Pachysolen tannophilus NRRL Y-2460]|uniref:Uncharacterized protein n=1 Tax=Pachysolen tannophilus NRRL Y-2460 TaxID=669874 RepID=A0A1E4TT22_PACTA|nr:hypothetical protein PACTADRAFT_43366 [Pachysolen tannophilus NRRL Y-2460]